MPEFIDKCDKCGLETSNLVYSGNDSVCQKCMNEINKQRTLDKIVPRFRHKTFKNFSVTLGNSAAYNFLSNWKPDQLGVYLFGACGVGKSHLLHATLKHLWATVGLTSWVPFVQIPELLSEIKSNWDNARQTLARCQQSRFLFIDDFGVEKITEWSLEQVYLLIDYRYQNELPTFFSSNCGLGEIAKNSSPRISSRICEMCDVFEINGKDRRISK